MCATLILSVCTRMISYNILLLFLYFKTVYLLFVLFVLYGSNVFQIKRTVFYPCANRWPWNVIYFSGLAVIVDATQGFVVRVPFETFASVYIFWLSVMEFFGNKWKLIGGRIGVSNCKRTLATISRNVCIVIDAWREDTFFNEKWFILNVCFIDGNI